jgi:hypothetical protein
MQIEDLGNTYIQKVETADNPGAVLTKFYSELFDFPYDVRMIGQFNKLVKLYGRFTVFLSLMDMYDIQDLNHQKIFSLITYLCKRRFNTENSNAVSNMQDEIKEHEKRIKEAKKSKLEIRSPFDE